MNGRNECMTKVITETCLTPRIMFASTIWPVLHFEKKKTGAQQACAIKWYVVEDRCFILVDYAVKNIASPINTAKRPYKMI